MERLEVIVVKKSIRPFLARYEKKNTVWRHNWPVEINTGKPTVVDEIGKFAITAIDNLGITIDTDLPGRTQLLAITRKGDHIDSIIWGKRNFHLNRYPDGITFINHRTRKQVTFKFREDKPKELSAAGVKLKPPPSTLHAQVELTETRAS